MSAMAVIMLVLKVSIFLTALGYGLKTTPSDAFSLFRQPGLLLKSFLAMNIIMPAFAVVVALNTNLSHVIKVVLVALSVSPLPPIFPKKGFKAGGSENYVIGLLVTVSLLSVIIIPLTLKILEQISGKLIQISLGTIVITILFTILIPLFSGIVIRYFAPVFAGKLAEPLIKSAFVALIIGVLLLIYILFPAIKQMISNGTVLVFIAFVLVGLLTGHLLGGPNPEDRHVLALATAARHPGITIALANLNLTDHKMVPAAVVLYLLVGIIAVVPYLKLVQRKNSGNNG